MSLPQLAVEEGRPGLAEDLLENPVDRGQQDVVEGKFFFTYDGGQLPVMFTYR